MRFDIIDSDGRYRQAQTEAVASLAKRNGAKVLPLRGRYALPWLGSILRNMWAKAQGASLP